MYLWGFDVTEWAALISVIAGVIGALFYCFKKLVTDPANESNKLMSQQIKSLGNSIDKLTDLFNEKYDEQQKHLEKHDIEIERTKTKVEILSNLNHLNIKDEESGKN
ncbi:hypothetical protein [Apilactobacillus micheneri]|uniref:hypothetical protein n=1 Tax=Apilactobacillus micheneri TaxID=1899430 RepID=UPI000D0450FC|nr:hypothetical protein [Apilactobacillus micheneri]